MDLPRDIKEHRIVLPLIVGAAMIAALWIVSRTISSVAIFIPGVIVSFLFFKQTLYRNSQHADRILPLYLLALGIQFIHFTEEYLTGFTSALPALLGGEEYPVDYWLTFNMVAYFVFILGGIALLLKNKGFMIVPLFFILFGVLFNGIGHVSLSLYVGGYFPGLYTALIYVVLGPVLVRKVISASRIR
jgi:hypothetical protein